MTKISFILKYRSFHLRASCWLNY